MNDIDTAAVDSLKVLDPKRPIREADKTMLWRTHSDAARHANVAEPLIARVLITFLSFRRFFHLLENFVQIEARRFLSLRIFPERR